MNNEYMILQTGTGSVNFYARGSIVTVIYTTGPGFGSFYVLIDNVGVDNVNSNNASNLSTQRVYSTTPGEHIVTITAYSLGSANSVVIEGISGENPTGVVVDRYCTSGQQLNVFVQSTPENVFQQSGAGLYRNPQMLLVEFGVNDAQIGGVSLSSWQSDFNQVVAAFPDIPIIQLAPAFGTYGTSSQYNLYRSYMTYSASVATGFIDISQDLFNTIDYSASWTAEEAIGFFGTSTPPIGPSGSDTIHPSNLGHCMMFRDIVMYLKLNQTTTSPYQYCTQSILYNTFVTSPTDSNFISYLNAAYPSLSCR